MISFSLDNILHMKSLSTLSITKTGRECHILSPCINRFQNQLKLLNKKTRPKSYKYAQVGSTPPVFARMVPCLLGELEYVANWDLLSKKF